MRLGFREDTRGVSALVGAVLLLGILVIALASYQAIIVPQQNAQTEFDHNQQVEDEMVEFRNALREARLDNRERSTSVKLGTRYQSRTIAVNPPPATGTLQSVPQDNMEIEGNNIVDFELQGNQFFEYTPSYSEYRDAGTIRYENLLVYHEFDNTNVMLSDQLLIRSDTIRLVPSTPDLNENGIERVTYEPDPSEAKVITVEEPIITIPSELNASQWTNLLENEDEDEGVTVTDDGDKVRFSFDDERKIKYSTVEQDDTPVDPPERPPGADRPQTEINPAGGNAVILIDVSQGENSTLTFRNLDNSRSRTIQSARVPFFTRLSGPTGASASEVSIIPEGGDRVPLGSNFTAVNRQIQPGGTITLTYDFDDYPGGNNAFWVTTLLLDGGDRSSYFIGGSFSPTDPGSGNGNGDDESRDEDDDGGENDDDDSTEFESLEATVDVNQRGGSNPNRLDGATFSYTLNQSSDVELSIRDGATVLTSETSSESPETLMTSDPSPNLPLTLRADIVDGECYEITIPDDDVDGDSFDILSAGNTC